MRFYYGALINKARYYFLTLLFFFFVFGAPFSFLPVNSSKLVIVFLVIVSALHLVQKRAQIQLKRSFIFFFVYLLLMSISSALITLLHGTDDYNVSYAYLIFCMEAFFGSYLLYFLYFNKCSFYDVLDFFVRISFLQAFIVILMFAAEPFREFVFLISESKEGLMERYGGFRGFGLAGSVTYDLSVFLSISLMFISYLIVEAKRKLSLFYIVAWLMIVVAVLMTGRTGWLGIFFSMCIILLNLPFRKVAIVSIAKMSLAVTTVSVSLVYFTSHYNVGLYRIIFENVLPYAFEMFINFYELGQFSTSSSDKLSSMYFEVSQVTWFLGDGYWNNPVGFGYYMNTDAGYMRHLLCYGLFFSTLLYVFYILGFLKIFRHLPKTRNNCFLLFSLFSFYFIAHYKGDFLLSSAMNIKLFAIILVCGIYNEYEKNTLYS